MVLRRKPTLTKRTENISYFHHAIYIINTHIIQNIGKLMKHEEKISHLQAMLKTILIYTIIH